MFAKEIYMNRRDKLRKSVRSGVILLLGNNESSMNYPSNTYKFRQDSNFLYFFGIDHPGYAAVMDIEEGTDCIYGDDASMDDIIWMGDQVPLREQAEQVGVRSVHPFKELFFTLRSAVRRGRRIHFLPPYRPENMFLLQDLLGIRHDFFKNYISKDLIKGIVSLRSVKEECEIAELEKACDIGYQMHYNVMRHCKPGVMEHELFGMAEGIALSHGAQVSFPVILSQNSHVLHNHDHHLKLQEGRLMIMDAGAEAFSHYASDFTRTMPVSGKFTQKQKDVYNIVLKANNHTLETVKPGMLYFDAHMAAARIITEGLKNLGIMKGDVDEAVQNGAHALFMPHGLGHMMGLDVHDMEDLGENYVGYDDEIDRSEQFGTASLRLGRRLQKGFVLTVEPGIYFIPPLIKKWKDEQINTSFIDFNKLEEYMDFSGIRLEDDILITDKGCRLLGKKRLPITVDEVEQTMNG